MKSRVTALVLSFLLVFSVASPALGWTNGDDGGNGFGTHDWVLYEAYLLADQDGTGWFDISVALAACDDPDTVLHDTYHHVYDIWGDTYGDAPAHIATVFEEAKAHAAAGEYTEASYDIGLISHYFSDICNPLHTDQSDPEDAMHANYENAVETRTDTTGENRSWITATDPTYNRYTGGEWQTAAENMATVAHDNYATLVARYPAYGFDAVVEDITITSLNHAVRNIAGIINSLDSGEITYEGVIRIAGENRYDTSARTSQDSFPEGCDTVFIATGESWPDALCAAPLAVAYDAPLLLVRRYSLPTEIATEVNRLGATKAVILGGTGAVDPAVVAQLTSQTTVSTVDRIAGINRYDTAAKIADEVLALRGIPSLDTVFIATGANFADALAVSPVAGARGIPVLLTNGSSLSPETAAWLDANCYGGATIIGGTGAVSMDVYSQLLAYCRYVDRWAGASRYDTARVVSEEAADTLSMDFGHPGMAYGQNFPDALGAGVALAYNDQCLLLSAATAVTVPTGQCLVDHRGTIQDMTIYGGVGAIAATVEDQIRTALRPAEEMAGRVPATVVCRPSTEIPRQYENVTIYTTVYDQYGVPLQDASVTWTWYYKTTSPVEYGTTDIFGETSCNRNIAGATVGYTVQVVAVATRNGGTATGSTSFTPRP